VSLERGVYMDDLRLMMIRLYLQAIARAVEGIVIIFLSGIADFGSKWAT
jgi:hypothetical protein